MIEKRYEKLRENTIAEYRRIVTPFFYIKLKTRTYTKNYTVYWGGQAIKVWAIEYDDKLRGSMVFNEKLVKRLELENERPIGNVLKIRA